MKKLLLASAVAALSVSAAQANNITSEDGPVQLYGNAFVTVDALSIDTETTEKATNKKTTDESKNRPALNSNSSHIGFKGEEVLSSDIGLNLTYQLEYGIDVTDSSAPQFNARDSYLGLKHDSLGELKAGTLTAIDGKVDFANLTQGSVVGGNNVLASFDANRMDNAFVYTQDIKVKGVGTGLQVLAMYALDEKKSGREYAGIAGKYEPTDKPFKAGASYIHGASAAKGQMKDAFRVSGNYKINDITVGALYQLTNYNTDDKENALTVSGEMPVSESKKWTAYAQGDVVTNVAGAKDSDAFRVAVGGKYAFNKHTIGHVYGAMAQLEEETAFEKEKTTALGIGGGLEYKF